MTDSRVPGTPTAVDPANRFDHAGLKALAKELGRPLFTLEVLGNDPFTAGVPARKAGAEWFADLWQRLQIAKGAHLHRIHYVLVSQDSPVLMRDGRPYENTRACEAILERTSLDARYLGLIPSDALVDRRNEEPIINLSDEEAEDAFVYAGGGLAEHTPPNFQVPELSLALPQIPQRYHLEIWIEKTTADDVLIPLAERYQINLVRGAGEMSLTRCRQFVERAIASGRPVRILYISDVDPAGNSMPVATARKIEFLLYQQGVLDLDIQLRPVALTHDQCVEYRLPRTPLKETETRAAAFEARFGEGATELDALEALHPGELERILQREIARYYDADLGDRIETVACEVDAELDAVNSKVRKRHAKAIAALEAERKKVLADIAAFEEKARPVLGKITADLEDDAPDADAFDWPDPDDGDEDDDPLFDSTREYLDQIDRYKEHQGKPTEAAPRKQPQPFPATCIVCGKDFLTTRKTAKTCSDTCRHTLNYKPRARMESPEEQ
jgi:hypothetical protein